MSADVSVRVPCGCHGCAGTVVHPSLTQTLAWIAEAPHRWHVTSAIAKALGISPTNCANRMRRLLDLGRVEVRGSGSRHSPKEWRIVAVPRRPGALTALMRKAAACGLKLRVHPPDAGHTHWSMFAERQRSDADIAIHGPSQDVVAEAMMAALDQLRQEVRRAG